MGREKQGSAGTLWVANFDGLGVVYNSETCVVFWNSLPQRGGSFQKGGKKMKRAAIGMLVVFLLTVAFASRGDSAQVTTIGCVTRLYHFMGSDGKVRVGVQVGGTYFYFHANKMMRGQTYP